MKTVLVLCSGNSIRSQLAEGYLKFYSSQHISISSAGLLEKEINPYTLMVMEEDNLDISDHHAKNVKSLKNKRYDLLITVCDEAKDQLPRSIKKKKHIHLSIPDPDKFEGTPEEILEYFRIIRDWIKKEMIFLVGEHLGSGTPAIYN